MTKLTATAKDAALIDKIVERALRSASLIFQDQFDIFGRPALDWIGLSMDITACHLNGTALRLSELLDADDANFGHDVWGIRRFIDRETGKLTDHFLPQFAQPEQAK